MDGWTISVMIVIGLVFASGIVKTRREVRRARQSRWATWLDEPWNNDGDDQ